MDSSTKKRGGRPPRPGGARDRWAKARVDRVEEHRIQQLLVRRGHTATETGLRDFLLAEADRELGTAA